MHVLKKDENGNYIKSENPYMAYASKDIKSDVITFYMQTAQLKNIYRQGWFELVGEDHYVEFESVADHSWAVALLAISIIHDKQLPYSIEKCLKIAIIHDLNEIYAGDFTPLSNVSNAEKECAHNASIEKLLDSVNFNNSFKELVVEYEAQQSDEAIFIKQVDKLECVMQAACYGINVNYMKYSLKNITHHALLDIVEELKTLTADKEIPYNIRTGRKKL